MGTTEESLRRRRPSRAAASHPRSLGSVRLLPYLMPYRVRWIAMVVVALVSLGATIAIPLMTKAVIDGPVRHQDQRGLWMLGWPPPRRRLRGGAVVHPPLAGRPRRRWVWRPTSARTSTPGCRSCRCPSTAAGSPASCCRG